METAPHLYTGCVWYCSSTPFSRLRYLPQKENQMFLLILDDPVYICSLPGPLYFTSMQRPYFQGRTVTVTEPLGTFLKRQYFLFNLRQVPGLMDSFLANVEFSGVTEFAGASAVSLLV